jgi:hypothetical protein
VKHQSDEIVGVQVGADAVFVIAGSNERRSAVDIVTAVAMFERAKCTVEPTKNASVNRKSDYRFLSRQGSAVLG